MAYLTQGTLEYGQQGSSAARRPDPYQTTQRQPRFWHQESAEMAARRIEQLYLQQVGQDVRDTDDEIATKVDAAVQTIFTQEEYPGYFEKFPPLDQLESVIELRRLSKDAVEQKVPPPFVFHGASQAAVQPPPFSYFSRTSFLDRMEAEARRQNLISGNDTTGQSQDMRQCLARGRGRGRGRGRSQYRRPQHASHL